MHFKAILIAAFALATTVLAIPALENLSKRDGYCCLICKPPTRCDEGKYLFFSH